MNGTDNVKTESISWPVFKKNIDHLEREQVLALASDMITYLHDRACGPRFREQPTDRSRVAFQRVMVAAIAAYAGLLRDEEMDSIKRRMDGLEQAVKKKGDS